MSINPYAMNYNDLPSELAIFPLTGALLLPCGTLPLNIFEPRYLAMVEDALASHRMIGMIQPDRTEHEDGLTRVGCAGKITEFSETDDGRFLIKLTGICRFIVRKEIENYRGYRRVKPNWAKFQYDLGEQVCNDLDRSKLENMLKKFFAAQHMECDWDMISSVTDEKLITCLSTVCPFDPQEKQALLEAPCCSTRAKTFMAILEMAVCNSGGGRC